MEKEVNEALDRAHKVLLETRGAKIIKELLLKWTDPKPEYTGMSAHELSQIIIKEIIKINQ